MTSGNQRQANVFPFLGALGAAMKAQGRTRELPQSMLIAQALAPAFGADKPASVPQPYSPQMDRALIESYRRAIYNGTEPIPAIMPPMTPEQNPGRTLPGQFPGSLNAPLPVPPIRDNYDYYPKDHPYQLPTRQEADNWPALTYRGTRARRSWN